MIISIFPQFMETINPVYGTGYLIQTRIMPPKLQENLVIRTGLLDEINSSSGKKLILVTAPSGYGKSSLINEYLVYYKKTAAWVHLNREFKNLFSLLNYITASLNRLNPEFGSNLTELINLCIKENKNFAGQENVISELTGRFINELVFSFSSDVFIVLDDYHELDNNTEINNFLDGLIKEMPDNIHFIISSREIPELNLAYLGSKQELKHLTLNELNFNSEEIKLLANEIYKRELPESSIELIYTVTGGWVTGIHLVIQSADFFSNSGILNDVLPRNIYIYFAEEVFGRLKDSQRSFLLKTSHLQGFNENICNNILDITDSREILKSLMEKNIFLEEKGVITESGSVETDYNYIQLFKNFLVKKAAEELDKEQLKSLINKTADYFLSVKNYASAIDQYINAGNYKKAAGLLDNIFREYFDGGRFDKLAGWINSLINENCGNTCMLNYYSGLLAKYHYGNLEDAIIFFDKALNNPVSSADEDLNLTITLAKMEVLINQGKTDDAYNELEMLENKSSGAINKAKIYYFIGHIHFQRNDNNSALNYANKALDLLNESENNTLKEDIYNLLGNINITNGEFIKAIHYYELTQNTTQSLQKKLVVNGNLAVLYSRSAKFRKAEESLNRTKEFLKFLNSPIFEIAVKMSEYTILFESGDYKNALKTAEYVNKQALKIKNYLYISLSYQFLSECSYYLKNSEAAESYTALALKYINRDTGSEAVLFDLIAIINRLNNESAEGFIKKLEDVITYLESNNSNYDKAIALYYLAKCYFLSGSEAASAKYINLTFNLAREKGYEAFLFREFMFDPEFFEFACKTSGLNKFEFLTPGDSLNETELISTEHKKSVNHFIENCYVLKMYLFGGLKFLYRGKEIPENKWIRKKRKLILCYLLLENNKRLSKDRIVDIFFPDTPLESIDNTFHQAVSNIRSVLKSETPGKTKESKKSTGSDSDLLIYEDKTLAINKPGECYIDLNEFNTAIKQASLTDNKKEKINFLKKAAELYSGNVLEGYYESWCEELREQYREKFISAVEQLISLLQESGLNNDLILYTEKLMQYDKFNLIAFKVLIKHYVNTGNKAKASKAYVKFKKDYFTSFDENLPEKSANEIEDLLK